MALTVTPVVTGMLGTILKGLVKGLEGLKLKGKVDTDAF